MKHKQLVEDTLAFLYINEKGEFEEIDELEMNLGYLYEVLGGARRGDMLVERLLSDFGLQEQEAVAVVSSALERVSDNAIAQACSHHDKEELEAAQALWNARKKNPSPYD